MHPQPICFKIPVHNTFALISGHTTIGCISFLKDQILVMIGRPISLFCISSTEFRITSSGLSFVRYVLLLLSFHLLAESRKEKAIYCEGTDSRWYFIANNESVLKTCLWIPLPCGACRQRRCEIEHQCLKHAESSWYTCWWYCNRGHATSSKKGRKQRWSW